MFSKFLRSVPTPANIEALAASILERFTELKENGEPKYNPCIVYAKIVSLKKACETALKDLGARADEYCVNHHLGEDGTDFSQLNYTFRRQFRKYYDYDAFDPEHVCASIKSDIDSKMAEKKNLTQRLNVEEELIRINHPEIEPIRVEVTFSFQKVDVS